MTKANRRCAGPARHSARWLVLGFFVMLAFSGLARANQPPVAHAGPDQTLFEGDFTARQGTATRPGGDEGDPAERPPFAEEIPSPAPPAGKAWLAPGVLTSLFALIYSPCAEAASETGVPGSVETLTRQGALRRAGLVGGDLLQGTGAIVSGRSWPTLSPHPPAPQPHSGAPGPCLAMPQGGHTASCRNRHGHDRHVWPGTSPG